MGLTDKNLKQSNTVFHGVVTRKSAYLVGKISLEVAFGDEHDSRSETLTFEVVKIKSPYHALFRRPAYAKFMARPCYVYLQLKMLMTHKCRGSIVVLSISKSVKPNEELKEMTSGFQQVNVCKC